MANEHTDAIAPAAAGESFIRRLCLLVLGALLCLAPLAYGCTDREWQLALAAVFALGATICPATLPRLPRWSLACAAAACGLLAIKDFSPAAWWSEPRWRAILEGGFSFPLGWTFAASPALSLHALLVLVMAVVFTLWVRTLAEEADAARQVLSFIVLAAVLTGAAGVAMQVAGVEKIYGVRVFDGWQGFGPFPNRNHTATVLAMGAAAAIGLVWHSLLYRRWTAAVWAGAFLFLVSALIESKSRGGLVAMAAAGGFFAVIGFLRSRHKVAALGAILGALVLAGALFTFFGGAVIERFTDPDKGGDWATGGRLAIWPEVIAYWWDAPWLGHGLDAFAGTFPFYQRAWMDNRLVIHPESSWLQWLCEWGALPLLLALAVAAGGAFWFFSHINSWGRRELALRSGAAAAVVAIATHSVLDVPAHRWGTAALALAALAVVFRVNRPSDESPFAPLRARHHWLLRILPLAVCLFWALPLLPYGPVISPLALDLFLSGLHRQQGLNAAMADRYVAVYPLEPRLHELAGALKIRSPELREDGWRHFAILERLMPNSWGVSAQCAIAASRIDTDMAAAFWAEAVRRAGPRSYEAMRMAFQFTPATTESIAFWRGFARVHPEALLTLAEILPDEDARPLYQEWMLRRSRELDLLPHEVTSFYRMVVRLGTRDDFLGWVETHIERASEDQRKWVRVLAQMGDYRAAWRFLAPLAPTGAPNPAATGPADAQALAVLQATTLARPDDLQAAVDFINGLEAAGRTTEAMAEIERRRDAGPIPNLLLWQLARLRAELGDYKGAVEAAPGDHAK